MINAVEIEKHEPVDGHFVEYRLRISKEALALVKLDGLDTMLLTDCDSPDSTISDKLLGLQTLVYRIEQQQPYDNVSSRVTGLKEIVDKIRDAVTEKHFLDVGKGVAEYLGVSRETLTEALRTLNEEGYPGFYIKGTHVGSDTKVTIKVLTIPGNTLEDVLKNKASIERLWPNEVVGDNETTEPSSISSDGIKE
jgi:hypothetical protein